MWVVSPDYHQRDHYKAYLAIPKVDFSRDGVFKVKQLGSEGVDKFNVAREFSFHLKDTALCAVFTLDLQLPRSGIEDDIKGIVSELEFGNCASLQLGGSEGSSL